jgi:hypothetical protein
MKALISTFVIMMIGLNVFGQFDRNSYQTQKTTIKIGVMKDGEQYILENTDINLSLDYGVGNLRVRLENKDFSNLRENSPSTIDSPDMEREYLISGILPINEILNQKQITEQYFVELNLFNRELNINHPVRYDLTVSTPNPSINQAKFRRFILHGTLYNSELQLPYFEGFDDEIEIWIKWTAYYIIG